MKNTILLLFFCPLCLAAQKTLSNAVFKPTTVNAPLFIQKNEKAVLLATSIEDFLSTSDLQFAQAISNRKFVFGNAQITSCKAEEEKIKGAALEAGLGFLKQKTIKNSTDEYPVNVVGELAAGLGWGAMKNEYYRSNDFFFPPSPEVQRGNSEVRFAKVFFQPLIGLRTRNVEFGFTMRTTMLHFYKGRFSGNANEGIKAYDLLKEKPTQFFLEPSATFRVGRKKSKVQLQFGKAFFNKSIGSGSAYSLGYFRKF